MVSPVPSAILKFDTDFDFDSSNAQFIKEELEREVQDRIKGWLKCSLRMSYLFQLTCFA